MNLTHPRGTIGPHAEDAFTSTRDRILIDSLSLAVPLRIAELRERTWQERESLGRWHAQWFTGADAMMFDPKSHPGQFAHLVSILAVLALNHEGGITFAGVNFR